MRTHSVLAAHAGHNSFCVMVTMMVTVMVIMAVSIGGGDYSAGQWYEYLDQ